MACLPRCEKESHDLIIRSSTYDRALLLSFAVSVRGRLGTITMHFGTMKLSRRRWHSFWSCFSPSVLPCSITTNALTAGPSSSPGTPTAPPHRRAANDKLPPDAGAHASVVLVDNPHLRVRDGDPCAQRLSVDILRR